MPLLEVNNLRTHFHTRHGVVRAVDGVSFSIQRGETVGIVGESGSGKSVANYSLLGLVPMPPGRIESGTALFDGTDLLRAPDSVLRTIRGRRISMIFQDPMTALNPYLTVGAQIMEPLRLHATPALSARELRERARAMLESVGISNAAARLRAYPHMFSGGMRQRVMIAMALITNPDLLIADEPTTALDVTVQAQILALIKKMQEERGMAMILVTHNLGVVAGTCDRVLVMYAGRILESAPVAGLFRAPGHPYTRALMASLPSVAERREKLYAIPGMPPDLSRPLPGCPFAPRCQYAVDKCRQPVTLREIAPDRQSACVRVQEGELS